jgi:oligopeptide transport system ATP-binding protein
MAESILQVNGLTKVYVARGGWGGRTAATTAVNDVSFSLPIGGALGIVGESGSGKTTLSKILVGLETPTKGSVHLAGVGALESRSRAGGRRTWARGVQMVFQDPYGSLDPLQTGEACLVEAMRLHFGRAPEHLTSARRLGEEVGLPVDLLRRRPSEMSGGQRQRLAIARALAVDPRVVVFDEAVSALDVSVQAQVLNLIIGIRERRHLSYIFVTHDLAVVRAVTDDLMVMEKGRVVEAGETERVLSSPTHAYTQRLRASVPGPGWRPRRQQPDALRDPRNMERPRPAPRERAG